MARRSNPFSVFSGLAARPAGRTVKARGVAFSGMSPPTAGLRPAGMAATAAASTSRFVDSHVPSLWTNLIAEFGREVVYWPAGDPTEACAVTIIWKEGAEDESVSPGRYSHALVQDSDLPIPPALGDVLVSDGAQYDVVRIDAYANQCSTIVLQERS